MRHTEFQPHSGRHPAKLIHTYAAEKRAALELWAGHLAMGVGQTTGANVTALHKA
jgi:hypothetical protein